MATRSYPSNCICMKFRAKPPKFSRHVRRRPGGEELNYQSSHSFGTLKLWFQWWLDGWLVHWLVEISIRLENVGHHNMEIQFSDKSHLGQRQHGQIASGGAISKHICLVALVQLLWIHVYLGIHRRKCLEIHVLHPDIINHLSWRCVAAAWWVVFTPCMAGNTANWRFLGDWHVHFFCNALPMRQKDPKLCMLAATVFLQMTTPQRHVQFCAKARLFQIGRKVQPIASPMAKSCRNKKTVRAPSSYEWRFFTPISRVVITPVTL